MASNGHETVFCESSDESWPRIDDRPRSFVRHMHGFQEMPLETKTWMVSWASDAFNLKSQAIADLGAIQGKTCFTIPLQSVLAHKYDNSRRKRRRIL